MSVGFSNVTVRTMHTESIQTFFDDGISNKTPLVRLRPQAKFKESKPNIFISLEPIITRVFSPHVQQRAVGVG